MQVKESCLCQSLNVTSVSAKDHFLNVWVNCAQNGMREHQLCLLWFY
jgi:hypothetical protein